MPGVSPPTASDDFRRLLDGVVASASVTVLAAAEWGGVALFLVPLPLASAMLVVGARRERTDTFLLMLVAISLLPAIWATAVRANFGPCDGCVTGSAKDLMVLVFPTVPLLVAAVVLLFMGRTLPAAVVSVVGQALLAVGIWKIDQVMSIFLVLSILAEVAYVVLKRAAARDIETVSAGNGRPGGDRLLTRE
jgi:hypothetical protein